MLSVTHASIARHDQGAFEHELDAICQGDGVACGNRRDGHLLHHLLQLGSGKGTKHGRCLQLPTDELHIGLRLP